MTDQIGLALSLPDECQFNNFLVLPEPGHDVVLFLRQQFGPEAERFVYLWGARGSGRSHLLQGACHYWASHNWSVQYLPLADLRYFAPDRVLAGLDNIDLICIDEINLVESDRGWLESLFYFFNRRQERGRCLLVSADAPPRHLQLQLADLQSRLSTGTVFQLPSYSDEEKINILQFRAGHLGLQLSDDAAGFLLARAPRYMDVLIEKLHQLDHKSLAHQRKLSVPFIKQIFGW
jgi:DnaA-homolog protein